jgi:hypothetical protein
VLLPKATRKTALFPSACGEKKLTTSSVEGEPARAEVQGIASEIKLPTDDAGFQLHGSVATIAEAVKDCLQVSKKENRDTGVSREFLL